jgi:DNA polymerase III epsilon subunit family exonuclease
MKTTPVIVLDIETTGLSPYRNKITEIAAARVINGEIVDKFHTLINPETHIPSFITKLTGISDEMVKDAPTVSKILPSLRDFLGEDIIVAHNASFDHNFLSYNFYIHEKKHLENPRLCTVKLANRIHSELPSKRLSSLCEFYGVTNENAHRAMSDVDATIKIFYGMLDHLEKCNICSSSQVLAFEQLARNKAVEKIKPVLFFE